MCASGIRNILWQGEAVQNRHEPIKSNRMHSKRKSRCLKNIIRSFLVVTMLCPASAETFRVRKLFPISISSEHQEAQKITTGINDSIAIFLPKDMTYIAGFEVLADIPDEVAEWRDCVALSLYGDVSPVPNESIIDYTGERIFVRPLPNRPSWALRVPLSNNGEIKESAYTEKADVIPDISAGFVFVRLQPAMKGIPDETMDAELAISVRPLLKKIGRMALSITPAADEKEFSLFIDNVKTPYTETGYLLSTGAHEVSIVSDLYRNEVRTVNIDTAKTTTLSIPLKSVEPALTILAPDNAVVTLDGEACAIGSEFTVNDGEHTISIRVGDWEVVRSITIQRGKSYTADFTVDLKLTEE